MNSLRFFSKRSGLVKLIEHQMQYKITGFFSSICKIISKQRFWRCNRLIIRNKYGLRVKKSPSVEGLFINVVHFLFSYYFKFNFGRLTITKIDSGFVRTDFFQFFRKSDFLTIDLISFLLTDSTAHL